VAEGRVGVSVGDVAGSGLEAAVRMGNVRQILRGAAHIFADPMMMLDVADRTLRSEHENSLVTAFIGVIDPARATLLFASAGHLPALLRDAAGRVTELHAAGLPLGCRDLAASESRTVLLPPGATLLLYTDGLVEWGHDVVHGSALLRDRFAALDAGQAHPAKRLVSEVLPRSGALDDVAALIVTVADSRKSESGAN
jgi:serine phosphatase RsbU (regulator of sigma subunit)